eukprot:Clim_evm12s249 gene=Clim_evmTU12s249
MKKFIAVFLAVVALFAVAHAAEFPEEEDVLVLSAENFDDALKEFPYILVEFYAPWCGHCKKLAPDYAAAAGELKTQTEPVIKLAKVDATEQESLATRFGVRGYPTLKFFKSGNEVEYTGGRTKPEIINWLNKKTGPVATPVNTPAELEELQGKHEVVVVGLFKDEESDAAKNFLAVADMTEDVHFVISKHDDVHGHLKSEEGKIVLLKNFDEKRNDYEGEHSASALSSFIAGNSLPTLIEFTEESAKKVFGGEIKRHSLLFVNKADDGFATLLEGYGEAAKDFKGEVLYIYLDTDNAATSNVYEFFGIDRNALPTIRYIDMGGADMVKFAPELSGTDTAAFKDACRKFVNGELKPHLKSAEAPEDWNKTPVWTLTGSVWEEAKALGKDLFVEFYAPWCGHCKKLAPIWDELGEKYKDNDNVIIAKVDATENEFEDVAIRGFPTLKFWPAGSDSAMDYNGDRTLEELISFLKTNVKAAKSDEL